MTKTEESNIQTGYDLLLQEAEKLIGEIAEDTKLEYPNTGYYLPTILGFFNEKITPVEQLKEIFLLFNKNQNDIPKGLQSLILLEIIEALRFSQQDDLYVEPYVGFIPDSVFRKLGVPLVDGSIQGIGVIVGEVDNSDLLKEIVKDFQKKGILLILVGKVIKQLQAANVKIGLDRLIVPLGEDIISSTHAINLAVRMALSFGGVPLGDTEKIMNYLSEKIPLFVLALGRPSETLKTIASGLSACGIPIIPQFEINSKAGVLTNDEITDLVNACLATKGIKPKVEDLAIPIDYSFAFEGQSVRKTDAYVEFGGGRSPALELLRIKEIDEIIDGNIILHGSDVDQLDEGAIVPLAILVEVSGKGMLEDFEPVLERQIHHYINFGDGLWHNAQRDIIWLRISKEAVGKGFTIKHLGTIIYTKIHSVFSSIVDKVQVTLYTEESAVKQLQIEAKEKYLQRDNRIKNLKDESVKTFYSCLLCQSFAPDHVCIISPERTGLCGAVNWLDAKTSFEINPTGGNQPVDIGSLQDAKLGRWSGVNDYVLRESHQTIKDVCLYSIMINPLTSCGCFECIAAVVPEANGIMIVNREYSGNTPLGIPFTTLAGTVGGGAQTPGFIGIGKHYIVSEKFILAEGGLKRVVWMPKELKFFLHDKIENLELGFSSKIADEDSVETLEELLSFLKAVEHPALNLDSIL